MIFAIVERATGEFKGSSPHRANVENENFDPSTQMLVELPEHLGGHPKPAIDGQLKTSHRE
jgi:hypothetical protein